MKALYTDDSALNGAGIAASSRAARQISKIMESLEKDGFNINDITVMLMNIVINKRNELVLSGLLNNPTTEKGDE